MNHPKDRRERRRSAEAKSLRNFKHKVIDDKKRASRQIRHQKQVLKEKEYEDELRYPDDYFEGYPSELPSRWHSLQPKADQ